MGRRPTLSASLGAAGDGAAVLPGPVEVVGRAARHLAAEGDGAVLGRQDPLRIHLHHQGGRFCRGQRSEQARLRPSTLTGLAFSPSYGRHLSLSWGFPTYPGAQLKDGKKEASETCRQTR